MKTNSCLFYFLFCLYFLFSCSEYNVESTDDFKVLIDKTTYSTDENIVFRFEGSPDNIVFYSGEIGRNYDYKQAFSSMEGETTFEFVSNVRNPLTPNNFFVLVSSDFTGVYDSISIRKAFWTDVTARANLPTNKNDVFSGKINIDDLFVPGKLIYIAFRYLSDRAETLQQCYWNIGNFSLETKFQDQRSFSHASSNKEAFFGIVDLATPNQKWNNGSRLIHLGAVKGSLDDDDWAITRGFDLSKREGDWSGSVVVQNLQDENVNSFVWKYSKPGKYKAVFIAQNSSKNQLKETIKEIAIVVE